MYQSVYIVSNALKLEVQVQATNKHLMMKSFFTKNDGIYILLNLFTQPMFLENPTNANDSSDGKLRLHAPLIPNKLKEDLC